MHFAQRRHGISYRTFASSGIALAEAQLHFSSDFPVDAITACSDAFRLSADLGAAIVFPEDHPPYAAPLVRTRGDLLALRRPDPERSGSRMADRIAAVTAMARAAGDRLLITGWIDHPFAEACSLCGVERFMTMLYDAPDLAHEVLRFLAPIVIDFACAQIAAGATMIGCGDAAASLLSPGCYRRFAMPYEREVCAAIHAAGGLVKLHICGNTSALLDGIASVGADLVNVDHLVPIPRADATYGPIQMAWKGGIDPVAGLLHANPDVAANTARQAIATTNGSRFLLSPGCEVAADTAADTFAAFCSATRSTMAMNRPS